MITSAATPSVAENQTTVLTVTATDEDPYVDYSVGITASYWAVDWTLAYVGTDLDEEDVFDTDWGEDTVVFTISKSM